MATKKCRIQKNKVNALLAKVAKHHSKYRRCKLRIEGKGKSLSEATQYLRQVNKECFEFLKQAHKYEYDFDRAISKASKICDDSKLHNRMWDKLYARQDKMAKS